jgi:hypothetical protein
MTGKTIKDSMIAVVSSCDDEYILSPFAFQSVMDEMLSKNRAMNYTHIYNFGEVINIP